MRTRKIYDHVGGGAVGKVRLLKEEEDPKVRLLRRNGNWNLLVKRTNGGVAIAQDMKKMDGRLRILKRVYI